MSFLQRGAGPDFDFAAPASRIASHPRTDLILSVVRFHEQILGCHTYVSRARTAADIVRGHGMLGRLLSDYSAAAVLPFNAAAATAFDGLVAQRVRIGTMDPRIASIALANGLVLVTRNVTDFRRVPGLTTEDWTT